MTDFFFELIKNKIILSVLVAYLIAGFLKVLFHLIINKVLDIKLFLKTGGMPSSHSATVTAMTSILYLLEGFSNLFVVSFIVSCIVIADALGVRRAAGKQAKVLNEIISELFKNKNIKPEKLYEFIGHTPLQVIVGILIGIFSGNLVYYYF
ncbi:MAG: divergent PAP2 family protein [Candidatus Woesearchaeota archaeon]